MTTKIKLSTNVADVDVTTTAPTDGQSLVYSTSSSKWIPGAAAGGGVTVYATIDDLPLSGVSTGDLALVDSTNKLYLWMDTGWYNIATINTNPSITSGNNTPYLLATDGTPTEITLIASDPEGIPLTWSYEVTSGSLTNGGGTTATVSNVDNVFTVTPTTTEAYAGAFSLTFKASDGVNLGTTVAAFTLAFRIPDSNYTTLLAKGTAATQNATFVDSSTNAHTITRNGDVYQGTFSPYREGGYSYYLPSAVNSYISVAQSSAFDFGTGDFTIETWLCHEAKTTARTDRRYILSTENTWDGYRWNFYSSFTGYVNKVSFYTYQDYINNANTPMLVSTTTLEVGSWYHVAVTRSGNTFMLFVNGVLEASSTRFTGIVGDSTNPVYVGGTSGQTDRTLSGYVSNARIVKGTAVYTANFTPPTAPLTAISNTSLLINTPYIADSSSNAHAITVNGNTSTQPFSPFDYEAYDEAVNGGSAYFDGGGDELSVPSSSDFAYGTGDFTWELWIYPTSASWTSGNTYLIDHGSNGGTLSYYGDSLKYYNPATATGSPLYTGAALVAPNTWTHIAAARESGTTRVFVNGILTKSGSDSNNFTAQAFTVGGWGGGNGFDFQGYISDVRLIKGTAVYTSDFTPPTEPLTAITNTSLLLNFTNAGIQDYSQVGDLKLAGNATGSSTQTKYASYSMYFDGTGDYIELDGSDEFKLGTGDFTIELWMYCQSNTAPNSTSPVLMDFRPPSTNGAYILFYMPSTTNTLVLYADSAARITGSITLNQWQHIALVRSSGTTKLYIDGTQSGSSYTDANDYTVGADRPRICANGANPDGNFTGYIEDLRITKGLARYTANFTPPTSELLG